MPKKSQINRIKVVLVERGITQRELAKAVKRTYSAVSRICTNDSQPTLYLLRDIAAYLGVDIRELLMPTPNKHNK
jgi:putative transcriptional regulator